MNTGAILLVMLLSATNAARILGVIPTPSYSHQITFQPIFKELSLRGHQVTVITTNPQNNPLLTNLTEIDLGSSYAIVNNINIPETMEKNFFSLISVALDLGAKLFENTISHPEVREMMKNESEHFDLVMLEILAPGLQAFPERFRCPFIGMSPMNVHNRVYEDTGNPSNPILYPDFNLDVNISVANRTFWDRLLCLGFDLVNNILYKYSMVPNRQRAVEKYIGKNFTSMVETERKPSMLFINTDMVFHAVRPLLPNVIRINGLHLNKPKPLPKNLNQLLDGARRGVVYCSFGSNIKSKDLTVETQKNILETFADLPYLVLWKFEMHGLMETPKNVIMSKWFPQQDVLGHPNVVLFITQGGLQSIDEGIHNSVPFVGVPFMGDQLRNVRAMVDKGIALSVDYTKLTKRSFKDAIVEVINNPRYRNQVKKISKLLKDEPMTGLEKAVWWTEYVIRHNGAPHLRISEIPFYQYYLLDVIGFCSVLTLGVVYVAVKILSFLTRIIMYYNVTLKVKIQ